MLHKNVIIYLTSNNISSDFIIFLVIFYPLFLILFI